METSEEGKKVITMKKENVELNIRVTYYRN